METEAEMEVRRPQAEQRPRAAGSGKDGRKPRAFGGRPALLTPSFQTPASQLSESKYSF